MGTWDQWYRAKGYKVEKEIPYIGKLVKKGSRILDLGCGHGRHVIYFASKGYDVVGVDNYKPVLDKLKRQLKEEGLSAQLQVGDITKKLPYKNDSFDLIIAVRSITHANERSTKLIFKEMDRVLTTDGILFLQIPSYEKLGRNTKSIQMYGKDVKLDWVEQHTYVPMSGPEKGVLHHSFSRRELSILLRNYKLLKMHSIKSHYHGWCIVAKKR